MSEGLHAPTGALDPTGSYDAVLHTARREHEAVRVQQKIGQLGNYCPDNRGITAELEKMNSRTESLRTLSNHELVTDFFDRLRSYVIGEDLHDTSYEHIRESEAKKLAFGDYHYRKQLWGSEQELHYVKNALQIAQTYDFYAHDDGSPEPYALPLWVIGRSQLDDETTSYIAVSIDDALPDPIRNYGHPAYEEVHMERYPGGFLHGAAEALDEIQSEASYDEQRLWAHLLRTRQLSHSYSTQPFGIFTFDGPHELPTPTFTVEDLQALSNYPSKEIKYDIRPRVIARQVGREDDTPIIHDMARAELTDETMYQWNVRIHLEALADLHGMESDFVKLTRSTAEKRATREQVYESCAIENIAATVPPLKIQAT